MVNGYVSLFGATSQLSSMTRTAIMPPCRTVDFYGIVPGGTSFTIPQGALSTIDQAGTGFNWTVDIAGGTDILLVANDDRGIGSGGHVEYTIATSLNNSCLNNNSPSSTAGTPAGGSFPTSSEPSSNGGGRHPSS